MGNNSTKKDVVANIYIENGILFFIYKPGTHLNLNNAKDAVIKRLAIQKDKAYPVFCDVRGLNSSDKIARDYLAREGSILIKAVAFLTSNQVSSGIIRYYMSNDIHGIPTKTFTHSFLALKYLNQFK